MRRPDRPARVHPSSDYRQSHLAAGKGESYHTTFATSPYRRLLWDMEKRILDRALRESLGDDVSHLDFACGTGRVLSHLEARARVSVGVDVSPSMLAVARVHAGRSEIYEADLTADDILGDRRFNLITAFRFFANAQPALRDEAMRVLVRHLEKGGRLVFNNHRNLSSLKYRLARARRRGGFDGMSLAECRRLVTRHGLEIERRQAMGFAPAGDERAFLPPALLGLLEAVLTRCPPLRTWGENVVFVCRRNS